MLRVLNYVKKYLPQKPPLWDRRTDMVGMDIDAERSSEFLKDTVQPYLPDFKQLSFNLINSSFMAVDAHVYYGIIRTYQPNQIIEIGAGYSTVIASLALKQSKNTGYVLSIDPIHNYLGEAITDNLQLECLVETIHTDLFESLCPGDILFIDSSHRLNTGGDIAYLYCEVLPRLKPGVFIHVHDIYLPDPYPTTYHQHGLYYNEQFMLQALLAHSKRYEILWPGAWMYFNYPERLTDIFPEITEMRKKYPLAVPSSFWMVVR